MTTAFPSAEICTLKREEIPETVTEEYSDAERDELNVTNSSHASNNY